MNSILKATQVFIENQPSQWMLYTGKSSFGADSFAYTDSEEKANKIVRACNSYEAMRAACQTALDNLKPKYSSDHIVIRQLTNALTLAEGKE